MFSDMNKIILSTVKISQKGITEVEGKRDSIFVPRERINSVNLLYGCGVQRPLIQTVLGIALVLIPLYFFLPPFWELVNSQINSNNQGGGRALQFFALPLLFVPFGIWFLMEVFKKSFYFLIKTKTENKKIVLRRKVSQAELYQFIEQAKNDFCYSITVELKDFT